MERKALGRGLASLIPVAAGETVSSPGGGVSSVPVAKLRENPQQPRKTFDEGKIDELARSIREQGVLVPLIASVRDGQYLLISGERRLRAARAAGLTEVPVLLRDGGDAERLELALIENIQREDLDPIEEASAYQMLIDRFGQTQEQVAQRVSKDRATVANLLRLLKLPLRARQALQAGQISMGHARGLLGVPEMERQLYFLEKIIEEGWSVRELETRVAARRMIGIKSRVRNLKPLSPAIVHALDEFRRVLGTQVRVVPGTTKQGGGGRAGKILIEYYSEEDLERLYRIIVR